MTPTEQRRQSIIHPPPRLKVSEWAERFAYIPDEGNQEPGKYHLSRMPHQQAMLDDPLDPNVREIFWEMCSQYAGKTMCLIVLTCYCIEHLKKSLLMTRRTKDDGTEWMRDKAIPTFDATPRMAGLLAEPRERGSKSTTLSRKFPGGTLKVIGAKSPGKFRGTSLGIILQDEVDSYETVKEGDPCALIDRAAISFSDAWKLKSSTPTLAGFSRIHAGFESGDRQYYFVPCPVCGAFQHIKTEQMKFSFTDEEYEKIKTGHPENHTWSIGDFNHRDTRRAIYVCEACNRGWTDSMRIAAYISGHPDNPPVRVNGRVLRSEWRATAPFKGIRSRHLNGMYGTIGLKKGFDSYLHQFAEQFLQAKREGRDSFMVWTNTFKTEPFEDESEKIDWKELLDRVEEYTMPVEVMLVVFGIDIQQDRVEITSVGFGDEQQAWVLDYTVIYGDFDMPEMHERVQDYLVNKRFHHQVLGEMGYEAGAIDSGHQTKVKAVFRFCKANTTRNWWAIKGFDNALGAIYSVAKERAFAINRFNLNVDYLKSVLFGNLKNKESGPNCIHFPKSNRFDAKYFQGVCSEKRIAKKLSNGGTTYKWTPVGSARNEALDMLVYCFGVFEILRKAGKVEWIARKWKEVCVKLNAVAAPAKEYTLNPEKVFVAPEAKQPELKRELPKRKPRPQRRGGMFNPLGL
jgi:phage terminase large subunit GpA-like protein